MTKSVKPLIERTRNRLESREIEGEQGSLILDILIGMAIFALVAIIAVSAISQYRERAYEQAVVSDAGAVGLLLEGNYTDTQSYPAQVTSESLAADGLTLTKNVRVAVWTLSGTGDTFNVCLEHANATSDDAWAVYDSAKGGIVAKGRGAGCSAAEAVTATF